MAGVHLVLKLAIVLAAVESCLGCGQCKLYYSVQVSYQEAYTTHTRTGSRNCGFWGQRRCDTYGYQTGLRTAYRSESRYNCCNGYGSGDCYDTNECSSGTSCQHNCHNTCGGYTCSCYTGYHLQSNGRQCDDINECQSINGGCEHNCFNTIGSYFCTCNTGFSLNGNGHDCDDINECLTNNGGCEHNCYNAIGSYFCTCNTGFSLNGNGHNCDDINECLTNNGGCDHNCFNNYGSFYCTCNIGYYLSSNGLSCIDVVECEDNRGGCQQRCINEIGSFHCDCFNGYALSNDMVICNDIDECEMGTDECSHTCFNTVGDYVCLCPNGLELDRDRRSCVDIDECQLETDDCHTNAICTNTQGSYNCSCLDGFEDINNGRNCIDIDECDNGEAVCEHDCENLPGTFQCVCNTGYLLAHDSISCEDIDECSLAVLPCYFGQDCANSEGSFVCTCRSGFELNDMMNCIDINECSLGIHHCTETQICSNTPGGYGCSCPQGYVVTLDGEGCMKFEIGDITLEPANLEFFSTIREALQDCRANLCDCMLELFSKLTSLGYTRSATGIENSTLTCSAFEETQKISSSDLALAILGDEGNGLRLPISTNLKEICYNCQTGDFVIETEETDSRMVFFPNFLEIDNIKLYMSISDLLSSPMITNLTMSGSLFLGGEDGTHFLVSVDFSDSIWSIRATSPENYRLDLVNFVSTLTGVSIPSGSLDTVLSLTDLSLLGTYDTDTYVIHLAISGMLQLGDWFSDRVCVIFYQSINDADRVPPELAILSGCNTLDIDLEFSLADILDNILDIDIRDIPFFGDLSLPKLQLAYSTSSFNIDVGTLSALNIPVSALHLNDIQARLGFITELLSNNFLLAFNEAGFMDFDAIGNLDIGSMINALSHDFSLPSVDILGDILDISITKLMLDLDNRIIEIEAPLKLDFNLFSDAIDIEAEIVVVSLKFSNPLQLHRLYVKGSLMIDGILFMIEVDFASGGYSVLANGMRLSLFELADALSSGLISVSSLEKVGIPDLVIYFPELSIDPEGICVSGDVLHSSTLRAGISACVDNEKDWIVGAEVENFLLANLFKPIIGSLAKRIALLNQELDIAFVLVPKSYNQIPLKGTVLSEITGELEKGIILFARSTWPSGCQSDIFCSLARELLGADANFDLLVRFLDSGVTTVMAKVKDFQISSLTLKSAYLDMLFTREEFSLAIAAEADVGPVTLIGGVRVKLPMFSLALELAMSGCWEGAFGLPVDFCNMFINVAISPGVPLSGLAFGGMIRIGTCDVLEATAVIGLDPNRPSDNFFFAEFSSLTIQRVLNLFCIGVTLPSFLGDTGFPDGVIVSYSPLQKFIPALSLTIPSGFYFKGTINIIGFEIEAEVTIDPPRLIEVSGRLPPINVAGLLTMTESKSIRNKGPFLYALVQSSPQVVNVNASGYVSVLGISVEAMLQVSNNRYKVSLSGDIFGVLKASLMVYAPYERLQDASFRASGALEITILRKIANAIRDGIKAISDSAKDAINEAQAKVDRAQAVFDSAVEAFRRVEDHVRSAREKVHSLRRKLSDLSNKISSISQIQRCRSICVPFLCGCGCAVKVWGKCVLPCIKWDSCCFRIPDPICILKNIASAIIQAALRVALIAAQIALGIAEAALTTVEIALSAARIVVDKARILVNIAKAALEVLKQAIRATLAVLSAVLTAGLDGIVDLQEITFDASLGAFESGYIDVSARISFFRQSPVQIGLRLPIFNPLGIVRDLVDDALSFLGRKRREIDVVKINKTERLQRYFLKHGTAFPIIQPAIL